MIEQYSILMLDNNKNYAVYKKLYYNNSEYLLLFRVDEDENVLDEKLICERLIDKNNETFINVVTDDKLYNTLMTLFLKELKKDLI